MREGSIVADLRKDYFLLCRKENLARSHSAKNNNNNDNDYNHIRRKTTIDVESATTRCINLSHASSSPTSPCQWNVALSRLHQLDSDVFDDQAKLSASDDVTADDLTKQVSFNSKLPYVPIDNHGQCRDKMECSIQKDYRILVIYGKVFLKQLTIKKPAKFLTYPMCASALPEENGKHEIDAEITGKTSQNIPSVLSFKQTN